MGVNGSWWEHKSGKSKKIFFFCNKFFEIISSLLAIIEAPIISLFQSLVKQVPVVVTEVLPHRCFSKKIIWSIPFTNMKRNNCINNRKMSRRNFYFMLFSFDQNLNSPIYGT